MVSFKASPGAASAPEFPCHHRSALSLVQVPTAQRSSASDRSPAEAGRLLGAFSRHCRTSRSRSGGIDWLVRWEGGAVSRRRKRSTYGTLVKRRSGWWFRLRKGGQSMFEYAGQTREDAEAFVSRFRTLRIQS